MLTADDHGSYHEAVEDAYVRIGVDNDWEYDLFGDRIDADEDYPHDYEDGDE